MTIKEASVHFAPENVLWNQGSQLGISDSMLREMKTGTDSKDASSTIEARARGGNMNVEHYHEFIVLAEELNFHSAAKRLCMTQSTLSKHLAALEAHYQTRLLERDKSHVSLTSDGSLLLESALNIWNAYECSIDLLKSNRTNGATLFIGGILDSPSEYPIVSAVVEQFKAIDGRYSTHFVPCISASLETRVELLQQGDADVAIVTQPQPPWNIWATPIRSYEKPSAKYPWTPLFQNTTRLPTKAL